MGCQDTWHGILGTCRDTWLGKLGFGILNSEIPGSYGPALSAWLPFAERRAGQRVSNLAPVPCLALGYLPLTCLVRGLGPSLEIVSESSEPGASSRARERFDRMSFRCIRVGFCARKAERGVGTLEL